MPDYRWTGPKPHRRSGSDDIMPDETFDAIDTELASFDDLIEIVEEPDDADEAGGDDEDIASWDQDDLPFDPSEYSVDDLREEVSDGDFSSAELTALARAERENKDRTTALDAIESHQED